MGKWVVIAGADGDLGRAVAAAFKDAGMRTFGLSRTGRHTGDLDQAAKVDLSRRDAVDEVAERIFTRRRTVRLLVNAAGFYRRTNKRAGEEAVWANNFTVADNLLAAFVPKLEDVPDARIITVASIDGRFANPNSFSYSVSKGAVRTLVQLYRKTYQAAPLNFDLISPGAMDTRMRAEKREDKNKLLRPKDVANLCVFLGGLGSNAAFGEIVLYPKTFSFSE